MPGAAAFLMRLRYAPAMKWDRRLARKIALNDGTELVTLRDAADALDRYFATVTESKPLEATIAALMTAARTGKRADVAAATDSLARMLSHRQVLRR